MTETSVGRHWWAEHRHEESKAGPEGPRGACVKGHRGPLQVTVRKVCPASLHRGSGQGLCEALSGGTATGASGAGASGGTSTSGTGREAPGTTGAPWKACGWWGPLRTGCAEAADTRAGASGGAHQRRNLARSVSWAGPTPEGAPARCHTPRGKPGSPRFCSWISNLHCSPPGSVKGKVTGQMGQVPRE